MVPKGDKKVRICVDLTHLNKSVHRERYPLPAVEQSLAQLLVLRCSQLRLRTQGSGSYHLNERVHC